MTYAELSNDPNYYLHHIASQRGYISRKIPPIVEPYKGRFGEGYKVISNNPQSTRYTWVTYFIRRG